MNPFEEIDPATGLPKKKAFDPFASPQDLKPTEDFNFQKEPSADQDYLGATPKQATFEQTDIDALNPRSMEDPFKSGAAKAQEPEVGLWDRFTLNTKEAQASLDRFDDKISIFGKKVEELTGVKALSDFDGDNSIMGKAFRGTLYMGNAIGNSLERGAYSLASFFGAEVPRDANGLIRGQLFEEEGYGFYSLFGEVGAFMIESAAVVGVASKAARTAQYLGRSVEGIRGLQTAGKVLQAPSRVERYVSAIDRLTKTGKSVAFGTRMAAKAAEYSVKEATVDFFFQDPKAGRLSDLVGAWAGEDTKDTYLSWLQTDETDTETEGRLKNAFEGMLLEGPFSVVMKGLESGTKMTGSALRGGLGLTENMMMAARSDKQIRKLTEKLSRLTDEQERATVLDQLVKAIENPEAGNMASVRAAVAGDLGDGRSPLLFGSNDNSDVLLSKTRFHLDGAAEQGVDRVFFQADGTDVAVRTAIPSDGIFVDVTNEVEIRGKDLVDRDFSVFGALEVPVEKTAANATQRILKIREELATLRGENPAVTRDTPVEYLASRRSVTDYATRKLDEDLKALEDLNKVEDLPELTRKGYESRIAANREKIAILQEQQKYLETFKDMGDVRNTAELERMLEDWGVAKDMIGENAKTLANLRREIRDINRVIKNINKNIEPSLNPRTAEVAWDLIKQHESLVRLENSLTEELVATTGKLRGLNDSFDLADGSRGKFRKNDFLYGRKTSTAEQAFGHAKWGSYKYGVARGFKDIAAAIYTALDSPYSGGKITIFKDAVRTEIDVHDLIKNPRKYREFITEQQVDQVLRGRFNGPVGENILTARNLFYEQMDTPITPKVVKPPKAEVEAAPVKAEGEAAPSEAAQMAETIAEAEKASANRRVAEKVQEALKNSEANRKILKDKQRIDAQTHQARIVEALGGDPNKVVPIGAGRSARVGDIAEVVTNTIHKNFLEPFRIEMTDEAMDMELGSTDFVERLIKISTKTIEEGSFARTYLHESFHAVLSVMENSPKFKKVMQGVRERYIKERGDFIAMNPKLSEALNVTAKAEDIISGKAAIDRFQKIKQIIEKEVEGNRLSVEKGEALLTTAYRYTDFDEYLAEILSDRGLRDLEYRAAMADPEMSSWGKAIKMASKAVDSILQSIGKFFGRNHVEKLFGMIQQGQSRVDLSSTKPGSIRMLMGNPMDTSGSASMSNLDYPKEILINGKTVTENFEAQRKAISAKLNIKMGGETLMDASSAAQAIEQQGVILNPREATQEQLSEAGMDWQRTGINLSTIDAPEDVLVALRAAEVANGGAFAADRKQTINSMKAQGRSAANDIMAQEQVLFDSSVENYASGMGADPKKVRAMLYTQLNLSEKQIRTLSPEDQAMLMAQLRGVMLARRSIMIHAGNNFLKKFTELKQSGKWNGKNFDLMTEAQKLSIINSFDALQISMNSYKLLSGEAGRTLRSLNTRVGVPDFSNVPKDGSTKTPTPVLVPPSPTTPGVTSPATTPSGTPLPTVPGTPSSPTPPPTSTPVIPGAPGSGTPGSATPGTATPGTSPTTPGTPKAPTPGSSATPVPAPGTPATPGTPAAPGATAAPAAGVTPGGGPRSIEEQKAFEKFKDVLGTDALAQLTDPSKVQNYVLLMQSVVEQLTAAGADRFGLVSMHPTGWSWPNYIASNLMLAPISIIRNTFGNTANLFYMVTRGLIGGIGETLTVANSRQGVEAIKFWSRFGWNSLTMLKEAWGVAADGWRNHRTYLTSNWDEGNQLSEIYVKRGVTKTPSSVVGYMSKFAESITDGVGAVTNKTVGLGTRISTATDEGFKQLIYRAATKAQLKAKFEADGLRGGALMKKVEDSYTMLYKDRNAYNVRTLWDRATLKTEEIVKLDPSKYRDFVKIQQAEFDKLYQSVADTFGGGDKNTVLDFLNISRGSRKLAEYGTFSDQNSIVGSALNRLKYSPASPAPVRFLSALLFPFVSTPINILSQGFGVALDPLKAAWEYQAKIMKPLNKGGAINTAIEDLQAGLNSTNLAVRANAAGRLHTSMALYALGVTAVANGMITGGGPRRKEERDNWMNVQGNQPYSIKLGDTWYSYQFMEPLGTFFGIVADAMLASEFSDHENSDREEGLSKLGYNIITAITNQIQSKTFLSAMNRFMAVFGDPESKASTSFIKGATRSLTPFASAAENYKVMTDPVAREIYEMEVAATPWFFNPNSKADKRYDILGNEVRYDPQAGDEDNEGAQPERIFMSFFPAKDAPKSPIIAEEFAKLRFNMKLPSPMVGGIDLRQSGEQGNSAYAQWLKLTGEVKINGKTLTQALEREIKRSSYQRLSPEAISDEIESPRRQRLGDIITAYRTKAKNEMMKQNPELRQASRDYERKKRQSNNATQERALKLREQLTGIVDGVQRK